MRTFPALFALSFALVLGAGCAERPAVGLPAEGEGRPVEELVLWAWERPEDLRFLTEAPLPVAVAPLVGTLRLSSRGLEVHGRRQPLVVPEAVETIAVVRIEIDPHQPPELTGDAGERWIEALLAPVLHWLPPSARALQVDFDARSSERDFYGRWLQHLRAALPAEVGLEMTALASWCVGDPWLRDLPIDDAVPMFFRMGPDDAPIRRRLAEGHALSAELCRRTRGVSTDEPWPAVVEGPGEEGAPGTSAGASGRRIYVFHPKPWDAMAYGRVLQQIGAG